MRVGQINAARLLQSRVDLTQYLVQQINMANRKPSVLLSGSATGFYGDGGETALDESHLAGCDFGAYLCSSWENEAQAALGSQSVFIAHWSGTGCDGWFVRQNASAF